MFQEFSRVRVNDINLKLEGTELLPDLCIAYFPFSWSLSGG